MTKTQASTLNSTMNSDSGIIFVHFKKALWNSVYVSRHTGSFKNNMVDLDGPVVITIKGDCTIKTLEQIRKELQE